jgi:hypothetical protein
LEVREFMTMNPLVSSIRQVLAENRSVGRKGKGLSEKDVDPKELEMGCKVELEHTEDPEVAKAIALDHLAERPDYYSKLKAAGLADELD